MKSFVLALLIPLILSASALGEEAPFIDAKAVQERWASVTAKDMDELRTKKILLIGMSLTRNIMSGLQNLGKQDKQFQLTAGYKYGEAASIPGDVFTTTNFVHLIATRYPLEKRVEQVDQLLRQQPWSLGGKIDAVVIIYSAVTPKIFPRYAELLDKLQADFPATRIIYTTASLNADGPKKGINADMHAFSELLRQRYRGKAPVYDLGAILSGDFRAGQFMLPEFTTDSTGVHANTTAGGIAIAQGLILALRDGLRWKGGAVPANPLKPGTVAVSETLPSDHPEYLAVRAILDHNGLTAMKVEGQTVIKNGHVVELFLQEAGVTEIPEAIGALAKLHRLHCYGDRELKIPLLRSISPAIGTCGELQELLLNSNELTTLPVEIAKLTRMRILALADNRLANLPKVVQAWTERFDPKGMTLQTP